MDNSVVIKGVSNRIAVILSDSIPFGELKERIAAKFRECSDFLGNCRMAVSFEGRNLSNEELIEVLQIINDNSKLDVICVVDTRDGADREAEELVKEKLLEMSMIGGRFYYGNLRSGQELEMQSSVVILGDVNPGAVVSSGGNILVLGALKGSAFAGKNGNRNAFVYAAEFNPVQVGIDDVLCRAPDSQEKGSDYTNRIAFVENENIYIEPLAKSVFSKIRTEEERNGRSYSSNIR